MDLASFIKSKTVFQALTFGKFAKENVFSIS